ncbi:hypothetical protein RF11_06966 [Thelohanellus kitauei]|uniref:Uncharacterized protein n=1 Tax=Thelohanellus kitauei TaxID=669202 RepID=A0A0C2MJZ1_THEKT|nr:hypothetical protein RF11_06966 [Thelohanellus kitauei]
MDPLRSQYRKLLGRIKKRNKAFIACNDIKPLAIQLLMKFFQAENHCQELLFKLGVSNLSTDPSGSLRSHSEPIHTADPSLLRVIAIFWSNFIKKNPFPELIYKRTLRREIVDEFTEIICFPNKSFKFLKEKIAILTVQVSRLSCSLCNTSCRDFILLSIEASEINTSSKNSTHFGILDMIYSMYLWEMAEAEDIPNGSRL